MKKLNKKVVKEDSTMEVDLSGYKDTMNCPYCGGNQVYVDHPYMGQFYDGESYTSECTCPDCDRRWNVNWTVKFDDVRERFDESVVRESSFDDANEYELYLDDGTEVTFDFDAPEDLEMVKSDTYGNEDEGYFRILKVYDCENGREIDPLDFARSVADYKRKYMESGRFEDMDGGAEDAGWSMGLELTSKEAYKTLGGRSAVNKFVDRLNRNMGQWANVSIDECIDEENPEDMDFLNVQIEMKYATNKKLSDKMMEQKEEVVTNQVWEFLHRHGLDFDYEASGDGEYGPIMSFRVRKAAN